jgi:hypothetical protein
MYICARTQRTLCVTSRITMESQEASSTALVNYSKILPLKYATIERNTFTMIRKKCLNDL